MNSTTEMMKIVDRGQWINAPLTAARTIACAVTNALLGRSRMGAARHLDTVSDHLLKDIGIQRHMIKHVVKYGRQ